MTLTSNMHTSESDYHIYSNTGAARRNSELAEIEDEVLMWQNPDNVDENIYEFTDDVNATSGPTNQVSQNL